MALYMKRKGSFVKLSREQARQFRRTTEVIALQKAATGAANTMRALNGWLEIIARNGGKVGTMDIDKLPNLLRIRQQAEVLSERAKALKWV